MLKMGTVTPVQILDKANKAFPIALISLGKAWIQLFSLQLWVNNKSKLDSSALVRQLV